uniref:Importin N-terminal domain-containing protein n=1 Tax=Paramoeba aestuarina TaxID=180227 RepID=A0A7S4KR14_9EUKA
MQSERVRKENAWLEIEAGMRVEMKNRLVRTLGSPQMPAAEAVAPVIARIAQIELPKQQWPELINGLLQNISGQNEPSLKVYSLKTLGYICEDIQTETLQSDVILTAIVQGMKKETQNVDIIVAACDAFYNCLKFIEKNFENENERKVIMSTLLDTASINHVKIQTTSLMCLVEIAHLYYEHLDPFMENIFLLTMQGIKGGNPEVACQAIEFWSTICDEEYEILAEEDETSDRYLKLIEKALKHLIPPLLECYKQRDYDDDDDDSLNVPIAASRCVSSIATIARDAIVDLVLPDIQACIKQDDWKQRDSATLLFADILDGPSERVMLPLILDIIPILFSQLNHESVHLKDTTCWTLAKICLLFPEIVQDAERLKLFLQVIHGHLQDAPEVANHCCFAIHNIAEAFHADTNEETSLLTQYYLFLIERLLACAYRMDGNEIGLRASSFEAIAAIIQFGAKDTHESGLKILPHLIDKLNETFSMQVLNNDDKEIQIEFQGYLCTILSHITGKVGHQILPFSEKMLELYLNIFKFHANGDRASIHEDVLMALGSVVCAIEEKFQPYLPHFLPYIQRAMTCTQESSLIKNCVGLITDLAGVLRKDFAQYCPDIIQLLLTNLKGEELDRNVKPLIISCFGDIANAIGSHFNNYLMITSQVLCAAASSSRQDIDDEAYQEFLEALRVSVFDAYTGIIQGLRQDGAGELFLPHAQYMIDFIDFLVDERAKFPDYDDNARWESLLNGMIGVIGDLAEVENANVKVLLDRPCVLRVLRETQGHESEKLRKLGEWGNRVVSQALSR